MDTNEMGSPKGAEEFKSQEAGVEEEKNQEYDYRKQNVVHLGEYSDLTKISCDRIGIEPTLIEWPFDNNSGGIDIDTAMDLLRDNNPDLVLVHWGFHHSGTDIAAKIMEEGVEVGIVTGTGSYMVQEDIKQRYPDSLVAQVGCKVFGAITDKQRISDVGNFIKEQNRFLKSENPYDKKIEEYPKVHAEKIRKIDSQIEELQKQKEKLEGEKREFQENKEKWHSLQEKARERLQNK